MSSAFILVTGSRDGFDGALIVPLGPQGRLAVVIGENLSGRIRARVLWEDEYDDDPNVEPMTLSCLPEELQWAPGYPKS